MPCICRQKSEVYLSRTRLSAECSKMLAGDDNTTSTLAQCTIDLCVKKKQPKEQLGVWEFCRELRGNARKGLLSSGDELTKEYENRMGSVKKIEQVASACLKS